MIRLGVAFLVIALIAMAMGLFNVAGVSMQAAYIVFFIGLVLFALSLIFGRRVPSGDIV
jgi:uncharacterized membrane protein YtjA (UPF0391 family)